MLTDTNLHWNWINAEHIYYHRFGRNNNSFKRSNLVAVCFSLDPHKSLYTVWWIKAHQIMLTPATSNSIDSSRLTNESAMHKFELSILYYLWLLLCKPSTWHHVLSILPTPIQNTFDINYTIHMSWERERAIDWDDNNSQNWKLYTCDLYHACVCIAHPISHIHRAINHLLRQENQFYLPSFGNHMLRCIYCQSSIVMR